MAVLSGGDPLVGIEPVEGLLGVAGGVPLEIGMAVAELIGEAGVVVAVVGVQVAAEAVGDARPDRGDRSACPAASRSDRAGLA